MVMIKWIAVLVFVMGLSSCSVSQPRTDQRVLFIGDSLFAWHRLSRQSVAHQFRTFTGSRVVDRSMIGAFMATHSGTGIPSQYQDGDWDWLVVNGGGNDLWLGCGCSRCDSRMLRLISSDGRNGAIPDLVARIRETGARVVLVGYLRSPGRDSMIEHCKDEGDELERRKRALASMSPGVEYVSLRAMVPDGDLSYHAADRIHPSRKGSAAIAFNISSILAENE